MNSQWLLAVRHVLRICCLLLLQSPLWTTQVSSAILTTMNSVTGYVNNAFVLSAAHRFSDQYIAMAEAEIAQRIAALQPISKGDCHKGPGYYGARVVFGPQFPTRLNVDWSSLQLSIPADQTLRMTVNTQLFSAPGFNLYTRNFPFEGCSHECHWDSDRLLINAGIFIEVDWTVQQLPGGSIQLVPAATATYTSFSVDVDCDYGFFIGLFADQIQSEVETAVSNSITDQAKSFSEPLLLATTYPLTSTVNVTYTTSSINIQANTGIAFTVSTQMQAWIERYQQWEMYSYDSTSPEGLQANFLPPTDFTEVLPKDPSVNFIGIRVGTQNFVAEKWALEQSQQLSINATASFFDGFFNVTSQAAFPNFTYPTQDQIQMVFQGDVSILCLGRINSSTIVWANASDPAAGWNETDIVQYYSVPRPMLNGSFSGLQIAASLNITDDGHSIYLVPGKIDTNETQLVFSFPPILTNNPLITQPIIDYLGTDQARVHFSDFLKNMNESLPPSVYPYLDQNAEVHLIPQPFPGDGDVVDHAYVQWLQRVAVTDSAQLQTTHYTEPSSELAPFSSKLSTTNIVSPNEPIFYNVTFYLLSFASVVADNPRCDVSQLGDKLRFTKLLDATIVDRSNVSTANPEIDLGCSPIFRAVVPGNNIYVAWYTRIIVRPLDDSDLDAPFEDRFRVTYFSWNCPDATCQQCPFAFNASDSALSQSEKVSSSVSPSMIDDSNQGLRLNTSCNIWNRTQQHPFASITSFQLVTGSQLANTTATINTTLPQAESFSATSNSANCTSILLPVFATADGSTYFSSSTNSVHEQFRQTNGNLYLSVPSTRSCSWNPISSQDNSSIVLPSSTLFQLLNVDLTNAAEFDTFEAITDPSYWNQIQCYSGASSSRPRLQPSAFCSVQSVLPPNSTSMSNVFNLNLWCVNATISNTTSIQCVETLAQMSTDSFRCDNLVAGFGFQCSTLLDSMNLTPFYPPADSGSHHKRLSWWEIMLVVMACVFSCVFLGRCCYHYCSDPLRRTMAQRTPHTQNQRAPLLNGAADEYGSQNPNERPQGINLALDEAYRSTRRCHTFREFLEMLYFEFLSPVMQMIKKLAMCCCSPIAAIIIRCFQWICNIPWLCKANQADRAIHFQQWWLPVTAVINCLGCIILAYYWTADSHPFALLQPGSPFNKIGSFSKYASSEQGLRQLQTWKSWAFHILLGIGLALGAFTSLSYFLVTITGPGKINARRQIILGLLMLSVMAIGQALFLPCLLLNLGSGIEVLPPTTSDPSTWEIQSNPMARSVVSTIVSSVWLGMVISLVTSAALFFFKAIPMGCAAATFLLHAYLVYQNRTNPANPNGLTDPRRGVMLMKTTVPLLMLQLLLMICCLPPVLYIYYTLSTPLWWPLGWAIYLLACFIPIYCLHRITSSHLLEELCFGRWKGLVVFELFSLAAFVGVYAYGSILLWNIQVDSLPQLQVGQRFYLAIDVVTTVMVTCLWFALLHPLDEPIPSSQPPNGPGNPLTACCTQCFEITYEIFNTLCCCIVSLARRLGQCLAPLWNFLMEKAERDPHEAPRYGLRPAHRRFFLFFGFPFALWELWNAWQTALIAKQATHSWLIQMIAIFDPQLIDRLAGRDSPQDGSAEDLILTAFQNYEMIASIAFSIGVGCWFMAALSDCCVRSRSGLTVSRAFFSLSSMAMLVGILAPVLPDYVTIGHLDQACPSCAPLFDDFARIIIGGAAGLLSCTWLILVLLPVLIASVPNNTRVTKQLAGEFSDDAANIRKAAKRRLFPQAVHQQVPLTLNDEVQIDRQQQQALHFIIKLGVVCLPFMNALPMILLHSFWPDPILKAAILCWFFIPPIVALFPFLTWERSSSAPLFYFLTYLPCFLWVLLSLYFSSPGSVQTHVQNTLSDHWFDLLAEFISEFSFATVAIGDLLSMFTVT